MFICVDKKTEPCGQKNLVLTPSNDGLENASDDKKRIKKMKRKLDAVNAENSPIQATHHHLQHLTSLPVLPVKKSISIKRKANCISYSLLSGLQGLDLFNGSNFFDIKGYGY